MLGCVVWELVPLGRVLGVPWVLEVEALVGVGRELPVLVEAERGAVVSIPLQQEASDALVEGVPVVLRWPYLWLLWLLWLLRVVVAVVSAVILAVVVVVAVAVVVGAVLVAVVVGAVLVTVVVVMVVVVVVAVVGAVLVGAVLVVVTGSDSAHVLAASVVIASVVAVVPVVIALVVPVVVIVGVVVIGAISASSPLEGPCVHELHEGAFAVAVRVNDVEAVRDAVDEAGVVAVC